MAKENKEAEEKAVKVMGGRRRKTSNFVRIRHQYGPASKACLKVIGYPKTGFIDRSLFMDAGQPYKHPMKEA